MNLSTYIVPGKCEEKKRDFIKQILSCKNPEFFKSRYPASDKTALWPGSSKP